VTYALTVTKSGTGSGTVTSPAGISFGSDCSETYSSGIVVTLSRTAAPGPTFAGWSGPCTGTGACQVTMSARQVGERVRCIPLNPAAASGASRSLHAAVGPSR